MTDKAIEVMNDVLNINNNKIATKETNNLANKINEYNARDGPNMNTNSDNNRNEQVIILNPFIKKFYLYIFKDTYILCLST